MLKRPFLASAASLFQSPHVRVGARKVSVEAACGRSVLQRAICVTADLQYRVLEEDQVIIREENREEVAQAQTDRQTWLKVCELERLLLERAFAGDATDFGVHFDRMRTWVGAQTKTKI